MNFIRILAKRNDFERDYYLESDISSVAYLTVANLVRLGISVRC